MESEVTYNIELNEAVERYEVRIAGVLVFSDIRKDCCQHFVESAKAQKES